MVSNYLEKSLETPIPEQTLGEFLFQNADKHADKLCQIDITTGEKETFKHNKLRSIRLAMQLQSKFQLTSKDVILTCVHNSLESSLPVLAGFFLGCKVGNLHPSLSAWQTAYLINLVEPAVVFVDADSLALIREALKDVEKKPEIISFGESAECTNLFDLLTVQKDEENFRPVRVDLDQVAIILFSSGTTGLPKGICHSHRTFMVITLVDEMFKDGIKTQLHFTNFYWISGVMALMRSFLYGRTRAFCKDPEGNTVLAAIEKYKINDLFTAPVDSYRLVNASDFDKYDTSSLKRMLVGGTPIGVAQIKRLQTAFPHTRIIVGYGLSECGIVTIFSTDTADNKLKSVGQLGEGVQLKIVDPETNQTLGADKTGEICVQSPTVMTSYYGQDFAAAFDKDGWLKTGDVGYYDKDGYLYIVERLKEMFKYKSWHIVPTMIETILEEHPAVEASVVFGLPSERPEDGDVPSACIVLKKSAKVSEDEIRQFVAEKVSDKEQLRGIVVFVDSLPRGPTGKVVRKDAKEIVMKRFNL